MELTQLKRIKNTGTLPGYANGVHGKSPYDIALEQGGFSNLAKLAIGGVPVQDDTISGGQAVPNDVVVNGTNKKTNDIPSYTNPWGKPNTSNYQTSFSAIPSFVENIYNAFTNYETIDELKAKYTRVPSSAAGIGYNRMVRMHKDGKLPGYANGSSVKNMFGAAASGATIGSVAGPVGAVIGGAVGLFGSGIGEMISQDQQRKNELNVERYMQNRNAAERSGAVSTAMQLANQKQYGNQLLLPLYRNYALGKVASANGLVNEEATARVSNGEVIANKFTGNMYRVPGIKNNKDGKLASVKNTDTVITNKYGLSDYVWNTGDVRGAEKMMLILTNPGYKCGKLPKMEEGWLGNAIPFTMSSLAGLGQYLSAADSEVARPRFYSNNPYEVEALSTLAGLSINPYPIMQQLRSAESRTKRTIDRSGGLTGGQRMSARLAALNSTQGNISNLLANIQAQNNQYKSDYATAAMDAGNAARTARISSNQLEYDMYAKAHAARIKNMQTGIANMIQSAQDYTRNEFSRKNYNEMMSLYRDDLDQRRKDAAWYRNNALNVNNNPDPIKNPSSLYFDLLSPYEKWVMLFGRGILK